MTTKNAKEHISTNTSIVKLVYRQEFFDISQMKIGAKKIATITADGTVVIKEYNPGNRKAYSVRKMSCSLDAFGALCDKIESCIENADRLDFYVDDTSEELKIFHKYGRIQIVDRGLGNEEVHIASIMHEFFNELTTCEQRPYKQLDTVVDKSEVATNGSRRTSTATVKARQNLLLKPSKSIARSNFR